MKTIHAASEVMSTLSRRRKNGSVSVLRKLLINLILLFAVLFIGTLGYMSLEGSTFLESFYMTVITLSTVGYGEVFELHLSGRLLTVFVIFSGLTIGAMSLGTITTYLVSGELLQGFRGRRMQKRLDKMHDHIIVAGYGKLGREVARELAEFGHDFCVIESDPDHARHALDQGYITVTGDATEDEVLLNAGADRALGLVSVLSGDAGNIMVTIAARNLNPNIRIVTRGVDESSEAKLLRAGADLVELPFKRGGRRLASQILHPSFVEFFDLFMERMGYKFQMREFVLSGKCRLVGRTLAESDIRRATGGAVIMAIKRAEDRVVMHPDGNQKLEPGDKILVLGDDEQMNALERLMEGAAQKKQ